MVDDVYRTFGSRVEKLLGIDSRGGGDISKDGMRDTRMRAIGVVELDGLVVEIHHLEYAKLAPVYWERRSRDYGHHCRINRQSR